MPFCGLTLDQPDLTSLLLIEELNHRVINQYTQAVALIRGVRTRIDSREARTALDSIAERLCDHAVVHRVLQLPSETEPLDLADYLERVCSALTMASLRERGILLSLSAESIALEATRCWRVGLIVAELITNAARHAVDAGGAILVIVEHVDDAILCRVVDNGGVTELPVESRGMLVIRRLAANLHGDVCWKFGDQGTCVELNFPKNIKLREADALSLSSIAATR